MTLDVLVADALGLLPACPVPMALAEARAAVVDFCQESDAWRVEAEADVVAGTREYTLVVAGLPVRVLKLTVLNTELYRSEYAVSPAPDAVDIILDSDRTPGADMDDGLVAVVSMAPSPATAWMASSSTAMPTVFDRWATGIQARTLHRLQRMTGRAWANRTGAQMAGIEYLREVTRAKNEAARETARR